MEALVLSPVTDEVCAGRLKIRCQVSAVRCQAPPARERASREGCPPVSGAGAGAGVGGKRLLTPFPFRRLSRDVQMQGARSMPPRRRGSRSIMRLDI